MPNSNVWPTTPPWTRLLEVLHRLDVAPANQRWPLIFREMLAGNWFDMGTVELVQAWRAAGGDVRQGHHRVPERPWRWDDVEIFAEAVVLDHSPVVILLDNAGPDTIFGAFSFARELLRLGREVRLAANDGPALNDVQVHDLPDLIARATQVDASFGALEHGIVNTGSSMPLLDLSNISQALARRPKMRDCWCFAAWGEDWRATGRRRLTFRSSGSLRSKTLMWRN